MSTFGLKGFFRLVIKAFTMPIVFYTAYILKGLTLGIVTYVLLIKVPTLYLVNFFQVDDLDIYFVGQGSKCIIWNYDVFGFKGGRTRQMCDFLADAGKVGLMQF